MGDAINNLACTQIVNIIFIGICFAAGGQGGGGYANLPLRLDFVNDQFHLTHNCLLLRENNS